MNRFPRLVASALSLSILFASIPQQAAAQTMSARVVVPVGSIGAAAGAFSALGGANSVLPAASLQTGLTPSLTPSAAISPVLVPALAPAALSATLSLSAIPAASVAVPAALNAVVPAAAKPVAAAKSDALPVAALQALRTGGAALSAAAKSDANETPRVALDALFEGSVARPDALAVPVLSAPADSPRLDPSSSREPAKGPRWVKNLQPDGAKPNTTLKRTLSVGFLGAIVPLAITMVSVAVAQLLGYHLHPNYQGPMGTDTTSVLQALAIWVGAAVMAPVSEEAIFRGGLQGRLAKLATKLHLGDFVVPALITSVLFVALHETSDPLLFGTRLVHAMILSYVYKKEGILASMSAHGFFNGLLALSIVFGALHASILGLAVAPLAIYFAFKARGVLAAQKPDIASGALTPKPLTAGLSFALAALLVLGYFMIMPNIIWPIGAVALTIAGIRKLKNKA